MNLKYSACLWVATKNKIYLICQWCNVTPLTCYLTTDSSLALKCIHKPNMIVIIYDFFDYNWKWLFFNKIIESERAALQRMTMQHLTHFAENDPKINGPSPGQHSLGIRAWTTGGMDPIIEVIPSKENLPGTLLDDPSEDELQVMFPGLVIILV